MMPANNKHKQMQIADTCKHMEQKNTVHIKFSLVSLNITRSYARESMSEKCHPFHPTSKQITNYHMGGNLHNAIPKWHASPVI